MAKTAREVVRSALSKIGVYARGRNLAPEDATLGFAKLKEMISNWDAEGSSIPVYTKDAITLTSDVQEFTVGPSLDIDITMPVSVRWIYLTASRVRMSPMSFDEWIMYRLTEAGTPRRFFYQYAVNGELKLDRPPDASLSAELWSSKPRDAIASIDSDMLLSFDEADIPAIEFNLAIDCAPDFDQTPSEVIVARAADYKRAADIRHAGPMTAQSSMTPNSGSTGELWQ